MCTPVCVCVCLCVCVWLLNSWCAGCLTLRVCTCACCTTQTLYDGVFIATFNVVFTSLPILVSGTLEQDVSDRDSISYPLLYEAGPRNFYFSRLSFYWSLMRGVLHSALIFFVSVAAIRLGGQVCVCVFLLLFLCVSHCESDDIEMEAEHATTTAAAAAASFLFFFLFFFQTDSIGQDAGDYTFLGTTVAVCLVWVVNLEVCRPPGATHSNSKQQTTAQHCGTHSNSKQQTTAAQHCGLYQCC